VVNGSVVTTVNDNLTAGKAGVGWNSVWMNTSRGNHSIVLGASQGGSAVGNMTSSGFTPNITVDGSPFLGPYSGVRTVEIRNGAQFVATFSHNFSAEDLDLNTIMTRLGQYWVGFSGKPVANLYVPLRGSFCNVRTCAGITNISEGCGSWSNAESEAQGFFCVTGITGTVAEEQADAAITKLVAAPIGWELAAVLFAAAGAIFAASHWRGRCKTRFAKKKKREQT
jgi:hypothetical protein